MFIIIKRVLGNIYIRVLELFRVEQIKVFPLTLYKKVNVETYNTESRNYLVVLGQKELK